MTSWKREGNVIIDPSIKDTGYGEDHIAHVYGDTHNQREANAALLAAAPDILEALKVSLQWHRGDKWRYDLEHVFEWGTREKELIALINKAENKHN